MAKNEKNTMLGYDPLAWMDQTENSEPEHLNVEPLAIVKESTVAPVEIIAPIEQALDDLHLTSSEQPAQFSGLDGIPEDASRIVLEQAHTLQNIAGLHQKMLNAIENSVGAIAVDASAVTTIDTANLQLFLALNQEVKRVNRELVIDFPSERFLEAAGLLGISGVLGVDKVAAGLF